MRKKRKKRTTLETVLIDLVKLFFMIMSKIILSEIYTASTIISMIIYVLISYYRHNTVISIIWLTFSVLSMEIIYRIINGIIGSVCTDNIYQLTSLERNICRFIPIIVIIIYCFYYAVIEQEISFVYTDNSLSYIYIISILTCYLISDVVNAQSVSKLFDILELYISKNPLTALVIIISLYVSNYLSKEFFFNDEESLMKILKFLSWTTIGFVPFFLILFIRKLVIGFKSDQNNQK